MVSIIASPTKSVRDIVLADSGWRAMASTAAATARPSARAGPIAPKETAIAAETMLASGNQFMTSSFRASWGCGGEPQGGPVEEEEEAKKVPEKGGKGGGLDLHPLRVFPTEGMDDQSKKSLTPRRKERTPPWEVGPPKDKPRHDRPGGDN